MATKRYTNETDILQTVYDWQMIPHRVLPGESVELELEPAGSALKSEPPDGMQAVTNLYRNPETLRLEVDFDDGVEGQSPSE